MANSKYINKRTGKYGPDSSTYRQDRLARVMRTNWLNKDVVVDRAGRKVGTAQKQYSELYTRIYEYSRQDKFKEEYEKAKEIINKDFKNKDFKREVFNDETLKKWIEEENEK